MLIKKVFFIGHVHILDLYSIMPVMHAGTMTSKSRDFDFALESHLRNKLFNLIFQQFLNKFIENIFARKSKITFIFLGSPPKDKLPKSRTSKTALILALFVFVLAGITAFLVTISLERNGKQNYAT